MEKSMFQEEVAPARQSIGFETTADPGEAGSLGVVGDEGETGSR